MSERMKIASDALLDATEQAIVDLSVHPAGCAEWTWYENLCLEVAERLDNAVVAFKAANDRLHRPPEAAAEGGTVRGEVGT
jgi:hypothetical protein